MLEHKIIVKGVNYLLRNETLVYEYLAHYSNELEEFNSYVLTEGNCVFSLEGHFGHLALKIFLKKLEIFPT
jgi:hypothetical protein